jgi:ribosomal protein S18 acetylase RimI-like enzyme
MDFIDKAFARRLEAAEEFPQVQYALLFNQLHPEIGAAAEAFCGGHMIFAGLGSPIGRAVGAGLDSPITPQDIDKLEEFYRAHKAHSQIDVCPLHDPETMELFKQRGYTALELNNVLWRKLGRNDEFPAASSAIAIRRGHPSEANVLAEVVARSFHKEGEVPAGLSEIVAALYQLPGAIVFAASADGKAVGAAAGLIVPEFKLMALCGAGTLEEYRNRGIQTSLLYARMKAAAQAGCEIAVVVTQGGSASQRNCERLGFRVAYSKVTLFKSLG